MDYKQYVNRVTENQHIQIWGDLLWGYFTENCSGYDDFRMIPAHMPEYQKILNQSKIEGILK